MDNAIAGNFQMTNQSTPPLNDIAKIVVTLAHQYDKDTDAFNPHELALNLPFLDEALSLAKAEIIETLDAERYQEFKAELVWAAGFTMIDTGPDEALGFTLFALPVCGSPEQVDRIIGSQTAIPTLEAAVPGSELCNEFSRITVCPLPIYPSQFHKLMPARIAKAVKAYAEAIMGERSTDPLEFQRLLGIDGRTSDDDGGECLLLGIETQDYDADLEIVPRAVSDTYYRATDYEKWRREIQGLLGDPQDRTFVFPPERLTSATSTTTCQKVGRLLDVEMRKLGHNAPDLYDEVLVERGETQFVVTAFLRDIEVGPVSIEIDQVLAEEDILLHDLGDLAHELSFDAGPSVDANLVPVFPATETVH